MSVFLLSQRGWSCGVEGTVLGKELEVESEVGMDLVTGEIARI